MKAYRLAAAARLDLLQIWNYLAEVASLNVADKVIADLEQAFTTLQRQPELGHPRPDLTDLPVLFLRVHQYLIVYHVGPSGLEVARVVHGARDLHTLLGDS